MKNIKYNNKRIKRIMCRLFVNVGNGETANLYIPFKLFFVLKKGNTFWIH